MKRILFIDRDGTLVKEPNDYKVDAFEKLEFYPEVFRYLGKIASELDFELVMVTNQDGLGTADYPESVFNPIQDFILKSFKNEAVVFDAIYIDRSYPEANSPNRKPRTGMLQKYLNNPEYDVKHSFVIGDRFTDVELAKNLGCKAVFINEDENLGATELSFDKNELYDTIALKTVDWKAIYDFLKLPQRKALITRKTEETEVTVKLNIDGSGQSSITTGIPFFDHMLNQLARHGQLDLEINAIGDLEVDEHHTIEDTAITLGMAFAAALPNKQGIERYGFTLPMDDCLAQVAIDFGGRNWLVWEADFKREYIGQMPTEMFFHFFKSFTDEARVNLNIKADGNNEHHKIEAIFKAFAKAIKMALKRDADKMILPSTKALL
ncbi:bifunctional histidinol-phosphatase/imidazoleglycerol-phosphate dehydratase HisB [Flavobacterium supellecticarium]|uniref:Histidine biosynthesis bifunctional protein HisB n=1 Tax=Flavobacterium supellecticarium TaxID=2565924 RepID=A0A4S4A417_9FLAO|nr:bifunctional histidinol-phosphatase/imidazoleglycerol-phosphate dehydratase HisB [Flavobacterium supellecticarium]THF53048.1 bifunctional histidinol-phosphatase/imidazoleglycerol-phosphate dehydratase HisB [Flavobacterium supellecticarium]